jgi:hypothetical protein
MGHHIDTLKAVPTPYVTAIASIPPTNTRADPFHSKAPPSHAPSAPSTNNARVADPATAATRGWYPGMKAPDSKGTAPPARNAAAEARLACRGLYSTQQQAQI